MCSTVERVHVVEPGDVLDADDALMHCLVRQPGRADEIPDRVKAGLAGAQPLIYDDMRAVDFRLGAFEADILDVADDADREDHALDGDVVALAAGLDLRRDIVLAALQVFHGCAGMDLDPLLLEALARESGDLFVFDRQDAVEHLDDGHLGAHVTVEAGEFHADRAGADDQKRFRDRLGDHRFLVGPYQLAVGFEPGQRAGPRAGRQHDMRRGEIGHGFAVLRDGNFAFTGEPGFAIEHGDLVLAHQMRDAVRQLLGDRTRAGDDLLRIIGDVFRREAELVEMMQQVINLGGAQQRFGRDAAPVEADAAELVALDQRRLHAELRGADCRDIAARTAADHDQVKGILGHRGFIGASSAGLRRAS